MGATCSIIKRVENKSLQWYGHGQRMQEDRRPRKVLQWSEIGKRTGRPALAWGNGGHGTASRGLG
jgi:hypothetical protein